MPTGKKVRRSYDAIAEEYARRIFAELERKPLDRELLDRFADEVRGRGRVCDLGCGPGHVARYLRERGVDVFGLDLSPRMLATAGTLNPEIEFEIGDVLALDTEPASWAGAVAFYSLIHLNGAQLSAALKEVHRVLQPSALFLLAVHKGNEVREQTEWWGYTVSLQTFFFEVEFLAEELRRAGFHLENLVERPPYPGVEVETERAYLFARRTG